MPTSKRHVMKCIVFFLVLSTSCEGTRVSGFFRIGKRSCSGHFWCSLLDAQTRIKQLKNEDQKLTIADNFKRLDNLDDVDLVIDWLNEEDDEILNLDGDEKKRSSLEENQHFGKYNNKRNIFDDMDADKGGEKEIDLAILKLPTVKRDIGKSKLGLYPLNES